MTEAAEIRVRQARASDAEAVAAFTRDTWSDREQGDYMPDVFPRWVETDGPTQRTFVLDVDDGRDVAGVLQCVLLSDREAWAQGMRVNPEFRGRGLSRRLSRAAFSWAREQGATVCRNMVFSWNVAGLGQSRSMGFEPGTEFRYATPEPDANATVDADVGDDPDAAWTFWTDSAAREALGGVAMDFGESWAVSELTDDDLVRAADDGRLVTIADGGTRGFAVRAYTDTREEVVEDGDSKDERETREVTRAVYAVGAWDTPAACRAVIDAVRRDAAGVGADRTRVFVPEGVRWVSDVAAARCSVSDEPDFVMAADLTDPSIGEI